LGRSGSDSGISVVARSKIPRRARSPTPRRRSRRSLRAPGAGLRQYTGGTALSSRWYTSAPTRGARHRSPAARSPRARRPGSRPAPAATRIDRPAGPGSSAAARSRGSAGSRRGRSPSCAGRARPRRERPAQVDDLEASSVLHAELAQTREDVALQRVALLVSPRRSSSRRSGRCELLGHVLPHACSSASLVAHDAAAASHCSRAALRCRAPRRSSGIVDARRCLEALHGLWNRDRIASYCVACSRRALTRLGEQSAAATGGRLMRRSVPVPAGRRCHHPSTRARSDWGLRETPPRRRRAQRRTPTLPYPSAPRSLPAPLAPSAVGEERVLVSSQ